MSTARRVLAGASWIYGAQLLTILAQLVYASITSRVLGSDAFGAYAVALSVSGFTVLIATGGLGQSVGRMIDLDPSRLRALVSYALLLGAAAAAFILATTGLWVALWDAPAAAGAIQVSAVNAFTAPLFGLATGLVRRLGKFRLLAIATLVANLVGMIVGGVVVVLLRTPATLMVSAIIAQVATLLVALLLSDRLLLGLRSLRGMRDELTYSWNLTANSVLSYLIGNVSKISVTQVIGVSALGQWNRAEVLTTVPFQQVQTAMVQAVYPEFRHARSNPEAARTVWSDLMVLVAWVALPGSAAVAVIAPFALTLMFGEGWDEASALTVPLAFVGGLQILSTMLGGAIESLARFTWMWITSAVLLGIQTVSALGVIFTHELWVAIAALVFTSVARHALQVWFCGRSRYLDITRTLTGYGTALVLSAGVLGVGYLCHYLAGAALESPMLWIGVIGLIGVCGVIIWLARNNLPPVVIARRYGLLKRSDE